MHQHPDINALLNHLHHPSLNTIEPGLDRVFTLLNTLGNPHHQLPPVIHVAGTNGKGSTCAFLTSIFQAAGLRVHRYTSPHLVRFNERILLADQEISDGLLVHYLTQIHSLVETHPATFFEYTTAAAFLAFREVQADVCILETGMGGRLDATNVISSPLLTIITPISMDHTEFLGNTLDKIAAEKAGIIKSGSTCIISAQHTDALRTLEEIAGNKYTPLKVYGKHWHLENTNFVSSTAPISLEPALPGKHQLLNAATACAAVLEIATLKPEWKLTTTHIETGIKHAYWPARLQRLAPPHPFSAALPRAALWLDGGHNVEAAAIIKQWLESQPQPRTVILGMLADKDAISFIHTLEGACEQIITIGFPADKPTHSPAYLCAIASENNINACIATDVNHAVSQLAAQHVEGTVLICGSLYLAGEVLSLSGT